MATENSVGLFPSWEPGAYNKDMPGTRKIGTITSGIEDITKGVKAEIAKAKADVTAAPVNTQRTGASTPIEQAHVMSEESKATSGEPGAKEAVYMDVQCFLEGVQVPHSSISISYGLDAPATCTLVIPASNIIRDLPETTKIHVFFKDIIPTSAGKYEWRLLFDGELSSFSYSVNSDGAFISINGIHSAAYMYLMQIMSLDIADFINNPNQTRIGDAVIPIAIGKNKVNTSIIANIIKGKAYKSMADIVYQLMRSVLKGVDGSATGKYYNAKLGDGDGGLKLLKRMFGVSKVAASAPVTTYSAQNKGGTSGSSGSSSSGGDATVSVDKLPISKSISYPLYDQHSITSEYGERGGKMHRGIDIDAPVGTNVLSSVNGTVIVPEYDDDGYGNWVEVYSNVDGNQICTIYAHLSEICVTTGDTVTSGQIIAKSGNTGGSTGPHLHYGMQVNGDWVNPRAYCTGL